MSIEAMAYVKQLDLGTAESAAVRLLMIIIAENTFNDTFVCRLSRDQLADEVRVSVRSLGRHLAVLASARLIVRRTRRNESGNVDGLNIRIRGFKQDYLRRKSGRLKDRMAFRNPEGQNGLQDASLEANMCPPAGGQQVSSTYKESRTHSRTLPPTPRGGSGVGVEKMGTGSGDTLESRCIASLLAAGRHVATIEGLIAPILAARPLGRTPNPVVALADIAKRWHGLPKPVLDAAVERCLEQRGDFVRCGDIDAAARWARQQHEARKAAEKHATREAAAMPTVETGPVWIGRGTPAFERYVAVQPLDPLGQPNSVKAGVKVSREQAARLGVIDEVPA